jgi:hypothetical protein
VDPRVSERTDDVEVLDHRHRPAVGEDERERVAFGRADVQEVDGLPVDGGGELRVGVELGFPGAPVVAGAPVLDEVFDALQGYATVAAVAAVVMPAGAG